MSEVKGKENQVQELKQEPAMSVKFTEHIMKEFTGSAGKPEISEYQKRLIQGYFIGIDKALKMAEENRVRKNEGNSDHKFDNNLAVTWNNVNLPALAIDLVAYAKMGLDMMQENHLTPIPYKNRKTQKYDVTLMIGYVGKQYIALKYAVESPKAVVIEVVYKNDLFIPHKKSLNEPYDSYEFEIKTPFDRGPVVGGFGYISYEDPTKNKLIIMSKEDIEKRKPDRAAAEFWGGTKVDFKNGKKEEKEIEGWYREMAYKTLVREVYSPKHIPRDPEKIDDAYQQMKALESRYVEIEADLTIEEQGNKIPIDTTPLPDQNQDKGESEEDTPTADPSAEAVYEQETLPLNDSAAETEPETITAPGPGF